MQAWIGLLQLALLSAAFNAALLQASLLEMKTDPSECTVDEWTSLASLSTPTSLLLDGGSSTSFIVGTDQGVFQLTPTLQNILSSSLSNIQVGGVAFDENLDVIFTDSQRFCVKIINNLLSTTSWAGDCGSQGDSSGTMIGARFNQLYEIASNAERKKFYVVDRRETIKVITPDSDWVDYKVQNMQQVYALVVASNGDLYFAAKQSVYRIAENSAAADLVAGRPNESGSNDGALTQSRFQSLQGLLVLEEHNWIIAADANNNVLRIIDMEQETVSSVPTGNDDTGSCILDECKLKKPKSLQLHNDKLYFIDDDTIKYITCSGTPSATTAPTTTIAPEALTTTTTAVLLTTNALITTAMLVSDTLKYNVIGERKNTAMLVKKTGPDESACPGTMLEHFSTDQLTNCLFLCVKVPSCQCLAYANGSCRLYVP